MPYGFNELAKAIRGWNFEPDSRSWDYVRRSNDYELVLELHRCFKFSGLPTRYDQLFQKWVDEVNVRDDVAIKSLCIGAADYRSDTAPWQHQKLAYHYAVNKRGCMLAMEMGTGKSKVIVDLIRNRDHRCVLILAPKAVVPGVWVQQFEQHDFRKNILFGSFVASKKAEHIYHTIARWTLNPANPLVIMANYHALLSSDFINTIKGLPFDFLVLDECHYLKAPDGKISKKVYLLAKQIPYRIGLSGTPFPHSPLDLYAQMRAIQPSVFGTSYVSFKSRYSVTSLTKDGRKYTLAYCNLNEFNRLFHSAAIHIPKTILGLPDPIHTEHYCELTPKAAKAYDRLKDAFILELDTLPEGTKLGYAISVVQKLRQIASGFAIDKDEVHRVHDEKVDLLEEVISTINKERAVVIFYHYNAERDMIIERLLKLDETFSELSGRANQLADWQAGATRILVSQVKSGGAGIDLTRASYTIYYSHDYNWGDYEQSLSRTHRPGQLETVNYCHLITRDTVSQTIYQGSLLKTDFIGDLLSRPRDFI